MNKATRRDAVKVFAAEGGDRIIRRTDLRTAELHEQAGAWRRDYDPRTGVLKGFRIIGVELRRVDSDLRSMHTTASISAAEMETNLGSSRTYGLREDERLERIRQGKPPEDRVERVKAKVRVYAYVGASKGDILRVWPR